MIVGYLKKSNLSKFCNGKSRAELLLHLLRTNLRLFWRTGAKTMSKNAKFTLNSGIPGPGVLWRAGNAEQKCLKKQMKPSVGEIAQKFNAHQADLIFGVVGI